MTTFLARFKSSLGLTPSNDDVKKDTPEMFSEKPYILCTIYYLAILSLIGTPIWYYTCSQTRYSLPELTKLESQLSHAYPRLHLDISVVQFLSSKNNEPAVERQSNYLRAELPLSFNTSTDGLAYNINWRIRRPTQEEIQLMKAISKENVNRTMTKELRHALLKKLEDNLLKIHKPANRFRLFMYLFEEPINSYICDQSQSYLINFERFIYLCSNGSDENLVSLIKQSLREVYFETVDLHRAKKILSGKTDLLVSLISERDQRDLSQLSNIADTVHLIHEKNVRGKFLELAEILNIRLITQNVFDLITDNQLDAMLAGPRVVSAKKDKNSTEGSSEQQVRYLDVRAMSRFYNSYEMRLNKHSSQNVHHVVTLLPDPSKAELAFESPQSSDANVKILEERDSNFILIGDSDKSLVLGLRAIVRRMIGLKSPNLCPNCNVRRDVFLNKWELDAIVGTLTVLKLQSVFISLDSISQQTVGITIAKYVSSMAHESHDNAVKALENLATKKPLEAYRLASSAYDLSEAAYYDPSLLETSYYPRETRWAIYTPLILPLVLPIVMSTLRLVSYLLYGPASVKSST